MSVACETLRYLAATPPAYLTRPVVRLQPVLAAKGQMNIDLEALALVVAGVGEILPPIAIESPEHWAEVIGNLGDDVDGILPVSISAYPTEIWNSHPQPLIDRGLPLVFWSILAYDEQDFWRWSARDFLQAMGVEVHLVRNNANGLSLLRALGMRRMLQGSKLVVFGLQNFPWNATAGGHLVTESLGTEIVVRPIADIRERYSRFSDADVEAAWAARQSRYEAKGVRSEEFQEAVRAYLAIKSILEDEQAMGFGLNCFGELIIEGSRDVPCLAQVLLREDGYIASCDGDYLAMMSMVFSTFFLDKPAMMSNMYPVAYVGAIEDHFGDALAPGAQYAREEWKQMARLGHCGFVGVVSPEMTPTGVTALHDWGGTYEIKRDGRGCGIDGELIAGQAMTAVQLKFDGKTLLLADAEVCASDRHPFRHCQATALIRFRDLPNFVENISREHSVFVYGKHIDDFEVLAKVLGLKSLVF